MKNGTSATSKIHAVWVERDFQDGIKNRKIAAKKLKIENVPQLRNNPLVCQRWKIIPVSSVPSKPSGKVNFSNERVVTAEITVEYRRGGKNSQIPRISPKIRISENFF